MAPQSSLAEMKWATAAPPLASLGPAERLLIAGPPHWAGPNRLRLLLPGQQ